MSELLQGPEAQDVDEDEGEQTAFKFAELSPRAQSRAIDYESSGQSQCWEPCELDYAAHCLGLLGISVDTATRSNSGGRPVRYKEFAYALGGRDDGASFAGDWRAADLRLAELALNVADDSPLLGYGAQLMALYLGHPKARATIRHQQQRSGFSLQVGIDHDAFGLDEDEDMARIEDLEGELKDIFEGCAQWIYTLLLEDYEDCISEERCREQLEQGDARFDEDGEVL